MDVQDKLAVGYVMASSLSIQYSVTNGSLASWNPEFIILDPEEINQSMLTGHGNRDVNTN